MVPLTKETLEWPPPPKSVFFQASGGPSFGHCFKRPTSGEWSSRLGPRNCGQNGCFVYSAMTADAARTMQNPAESTMRIIRITP